MKRIYILVEGQTEERFVSDVLQAQFPREQCYLQPIILETRRTHSGQSYKGGVSTYTKIRSQVLKLLADTSACAVTTMLDYYGLPNDFPGKNQLNPHWNALQKVQHLENAFAQDINNARFLPYLSLHEFEALLFSDIDLLIEYLSSRGNANCSALKRLRGRKPEDINENTPPSHRIRNACAGYIKTADEISIAKQIGLPAMLQQCKHFADWVNRLRNLCEDC
jgi:hypothetical protein